MTFFVSLFLCGSWSRDFGEEDEEKKEKRVEEEEEENGEGEEDGGNLEGQSKISFHAQVAPLVFVPRVK